MKVLLRKIRAFNRQLGRFCCSDVVYSCRLNGIPIHVIWSDMNHATAVCCLAGNFILAVAKRNSSCYISSISFTAQQGLLARQRVCFIVLFYARSLNTSHNANSYGQNEQFFTFLRSYFLFKNQ